MGIPIELCSSRLVRQLLTNAEKDRQFLDEIRELARSGDRDALLMRVVAEFENHPEAESLDA